MKLTFLGTGAATGVPLTFCRCATCEAARRLGGMNIRRCTSLVVNDDMLIDIGPDSATACALFGVELPRVRYLLQTHAHSDHLHAGHLITRDPEYACEDVGELTLVASRMTLEVINALLMREGGGDIFTADYQAKLRLKPVSIDHGETVRLCEYSVTAYRSLHDERLQALIFLVEWRGKTLLYATDICARPWLALEALQGRRVDALVIDQTYGAGRNAGGHPDAAQVAQTVRRLKDAGVLHDKSVIYATHLSHEGNPPHDEARALAQASGYDVAYDGLRVEI